MAASTQSPYEINDFSGGMTDQVFEQVLNRHALLDNFLINEDKKPYMRPGSVIDDTANGEAPSGARISALINYANSDKLFYQSLRYIYFRDPSVFQELMGPTGNSAYSTGTPNAVPSFAQWNRHLYTTNDQYARPMKIFKDGSGNYQIRSSGLPALATPPVVTAGAADTQNFLYAFLFRVDYQVFNLNYETIGPVTEVGVSNTAAPDVTPIAISGIPVLANGMSDNWDVANVFVDIYRTVNDGTFFQKVGSVPNGTTTFTDNVSDITLENTGIPLYTNDGTVDYDPPPLHKYVHVVNNTAYYAGIQDLDGESPYKIRQSVPGVPDTAPLDFEVSVDDELQGMNSVNYMPIALCKKYIYRIDQSFDQFGRGNMIPTRISDTAGCIANNSCVQAEMGLFWLGNEGVWWTDGYQTMKISGGNNDFYKSIIANTTQLNRCTGRFYEKERLVIWTIQRNADSKDNDSFLVLHLKFGVSAASTFTTWSGASFRPSAIEIFNKQIYRGDIQAYTFKHDSSYTSDRKINLYLNPVNWTPETIIWTIQTIHYNFGGTFFRKMPTRVLLTAKNQGNTSIQITAINDDGRASRQCKQIRVRGDFVWDADDFVWRVSPFVWRGSGLIEQWRRFPAKPLRLSYLQLVITNAYSDITNSDTLGQAAFDATAKTATLSGTNYWPIYSVDYYLYSDADNYQTGYLVDALNSAGVVHLFDPLNTLPSGTHKWVMRGYKKDESLYLLGFNIHWSNVSQSQQAYNSSAASTGENA